MNDINLYFTAISPYRSRYHFPHVVCNDGFSMSVQASEHSYCEPRATYNGQFYKEVEIGFPSIPSDLLMKYAETPEEPTNTVYPYVPVNITNRVISEHGGLNVEYYDSEYENIDWEGAKQKLIKNTLKY